MGMSFNSNSPYKNTWNNRQNYSVYQERPPPKEKTSFSRKFKCCFQSRVLQKTTIQYRNLPVHIRLSDKVLFSFDVGFRKIVPSISWSESSYQRCRHPHRHFSDTQSCSTPLTRDVRRWNRWLIHWNNPIGTHTDICVVRMYQHRRVPTPRVHCWR